MRQEPLGLAEFSDHAKRHSELGNTEWTGFQMPHLPALLSGYILYSSSNFVKVFKLLKINSRPDSLGNKNNC